MNEAFTGKWKGMILKVFQAEIPLEEKRMFSALKNTALQGEK